MKQFITILMMLVGFTSVMSAQDKVKLRSGETLDVKVVKVTAEAVQYVFGEETLVNETSKSDIEEIVFASGRVQKFEATQPKKQDVAEKSEWHTVVIPHDKKQADNNFILMNHTNKVVDYKLYGTLKTTGERTLIGRGLLAVYEKKKVDIAVAKGKLDAFTQFEIETESDLNFTYMIRSNDMRVTLYPKFSLGHALVLDGGYLEAGASELQVKNGTGMDIDFLVYGSEEEEGSEKELLFGGAIGRETKRRSERIFTETKPVLYLYFSQDIPEPKVSIQGGYFKITFK
ncbi:MAG: hypothetical protein II951_06445 [Bacteroidales bacterium]|nr:hypothetical protein [Bacteroidales bacterium]